MKNLRIKAIFAIAAVLAASCSDITPQISENEYDYAFDVASAVSANYFEATGGETQIAFKANLPFESTIVENVADCSCDASSRPQFTVTTNEIEEIRVDGEMLSLTRDILVHVRPLEICKIKGFKYFNYPVLIRQRGWDGTQYLTKEEIRAFNDDRSTCSDWWGKSNQHYVKGTVTSVGALSKFEGVPCSGGLFNYPLAPGQTSMYSADAWNLDLVELTVDVEGEGVKLGVLYESAYGLVGELAQKVGVGDLVEVNVSARGILDSYDGIYVHPLAVRKL